RADLRWATREASAGGYSISVGVDTPRPARLNSHVSTCHAFAPHQLRRRLVPRTRSSYKFVARSDANFGFRSGTTRIELLVSLSIPKFVRARRKCLRTSESGH